MAYIGKRPIDTFPAINAVTSTLIAENNITAREIATNTIVTLLIADNAITAVKIAENSITSRELGANVIATGNIADNAVDGTKIAQNSILTRHIDDGQVGTAQIAADAITGAKIADDAIDSEHYADGSIDTAHIADDQVTLAKMAGIARGKIIYGDSSGNPAVLALGSNGQVLKSDGTDIAWGADSGLSTEEVQDIAGGMFTSNTETGITATYQDGDGTIDLVVGTLNQDTTGNAATATALETARTIGGTSFDGTANIAVGLAATATALASARTIGGTSFDGTANIVPGTSTALATGRTIGMTGDVVWTSASFDGSGNVTGAATIQANAVESAMIAENNITTRELAANTIATGNIADNAVDGTKIAQNSILTRHIDDGQVTTAQLGADAVTGAKIADDAIDSEHYADGSIDTAHIADDQVTAAKLANTAVTAAAYGSSSAIPVITIDAQGRITAASTAATSSTLTIAADSGSNDTVTVGTDTLTFAGTSNEVNTTVSNNAITIGLPDDVTIAGDLIVTGDYTVNGTTSTNAVTNMVISDNLIELNNGAGSNANDSGIVIERGSTGDNAIFAWDESADKFTLGTTTATGSSTGNLSITTGTLVANIEGNITGNVTGNTSGTAATVTTAAQTNITSLGTLTALTVDNVVIDGAVIGHTGDTDLITLASGVVTVAGELDATTLDISGNADIDGTLEADAITVDGTTLAEYIADTAGAMFSSNTETGITATYQDGDNTIDLVVGTLNQDTTGNAATATALETARTIGGTSFDGTANIAVATATEATNVTVSANNTTDETVYPVFVDGATSTQGIETDTGFTYNPSSGNLTIAGALTSATLDISGNADIDGTLEADAYTVDGTALNEYIADTIGAMVGSNTETGIAVTYEDGDNTLDFVIGTLNQNTTGTAASWTSARTLSFTGDVTGSGSVDGSANVATALTIANDAVEQAMIADDAVGADQLAANAVVSASIVNGSIVGADIAANTITVTNLADDAVESDKIANNAILTQHIDDNQITGDQLADDLVLSGTGAIRMPDGTTGQRPGSPAAGMFRYNTTDSKFEGYTDSWGEIGGGGSNTFTYDSFTNANSTDGNSNLTYTLSQTAGNENNLIVFIDGVFQNQAAFSLSGTTLTLADALPDSRTMTVYSVKSTVAGDGLNVNNFSGNGSTTDFTLSINPVHENNTQVYIDGVYQFKNTYTVSGTTLAFSTAPPNGSAVEVMTHSQTNINTFPATGISGLTEVTAVAADHFMIYDATDSALKKALVSDVLDNVVLTNEQAQDIVGAMFSSNTETGITATYQDGDGTVDLVLDAAQPTITSLGTLTTLTVDDMTLNGSTISDAADLTIDVGGDLILDVDGTDIILKDGGTEFSRLMTDSTPNHFYLKSSISDGDIIFQGNDGGSTITAMTIDMSEGGNVGIGETTPLGKLHVKEDDSGGTVNSNFDQLVLEDDAHSGMTILSGTSSDGGIYFGDSGGNNRGQFKYKHGSDIFAFLAANGSDSALEIADEKVTAVHSANITQQAITSSSNAVAWDAKAKANAYHVTTENTTFSAPSNAVEGAIISVEIAQGGTARTIAWNTVFEFADSTAPTMTATANKTDIYSFRYNGSVWQEIGRVQNMAQT